MPMPRNTHPKKRVFFFLDERLMLEAELYMRRNISGKVKYGEWAKLWEKLLSDWLTEQAKNHTQSPTQGAQDGTASPANDNT